MVTLIALVPALFALAISVAAAFYFLKRKSLAQGTCVRQASILQNELRDTLDQLLRLNPRASTLRTQRSAADNALKAAISSMNPYAVAVAQAYWTGVYTAQLALRAQQEALLRRARAQRQTGERRLREDLGFLKAAHFRAREFYWRALAVEASPAISLTPDYKPLPAFSYLQQQQFQFEVDLAPPFAVPLRQSLKQITSCSVSLKGKEKQWSLQVLAASAPSKSFWF